MDTKLYERLSSRRFWVYWAMDLLHLLWRNVARQCPYCRRDGTPHMPDFCERRKDQEERRCAPPMCAVLHYGDLIKKQRDAYFNSKPESED